MFVLYTQRVRLCGDIHIVKHHINIAVRQAHKALTLGVFRRRRSESFALNDAAVRVRALNVCHDPLRARAYAPFSGLVPVRRRHNLGARFSCTQRQRHRGRERASAYVCPSNWMVTVCGGVLCAPTNRRRARENHQPLTTSQDLDNTHTNTHNDVRRRRCATGGGSENDKFGSACVRSLLRRSFVRRLYGYEWRNEPSAQQMMVLQIVDLLRGAASTPTTTTTTTSAVHPSTTGWLNYISLSRCAVAAGKARPSDMRRQTDIMIGFEDADAPTKTTNRGATEQHYSSQFIQMRA